MPTQTITNNPPRSETPVFGHTIKVGGAITGGEAGGSVTQHGHVWSTSANPTTADSKTQNGTASAGVFTSSITGLTAKTLYHVRAYAVNSGGTGYGEDIEFTTLSTFIPLTFVM